MRFGQINLWHILLGIGGAFAFGTLMVLLFGSANAPQGEIEDFDLANPYLFSRLQFYLMAIGAVGSAVFVSLGLFFLAKNEKNETPANGGISGSQALESENKRLLAQLADYERLQNLSREREARLEQAMQLAKLGYYVWDPEKDRCEFCSGQHAAAFGMSPFEFIDSATGRNGALSMIHPDDRVNLTEQYRKLQSGKVIEASYRVLTKSGVRRLREIARPILNDKGHVVREVGCTLDVTDQYETEVKLFEAQKMDSLGKMTGGVAHDFNNLLAVILGNLELLREFPDSDSRQNMIDDAIEATLRGRDLTMSMLSFARRAPLDPSNLDLNAILADMKGMLQRTLPENIQFEMNLSPSIWTVVSDQSMTESALLNLVINARDAMPDGGTLTIATRNISIREDDPAAMDQTVRPGKYVMMSVRDTGHGIAENLLPNIFEPFFTTKAITKNSGLGLSMVQGFVRQTGGGLNVLSDLDAGTEFRLYFKAIDINDAAKSSDIKDSDGARNDSLRVLLVEDDEIVRKTLMRQIMQSGMAVVSAANGTEAQKAFLDHGGFDVVVSDVVMPGDLQGPELVKTLRKSAPGLPAVLVSGYPLDSQREKYQASETDFVLTKPVTREKLIAAIHQAVNRQSRTS